MDIRIEKLSDSDTDKFIELIRVFEDVFEMVNFSIPDREYLQQLLKKEDFLVFAAVIDNHVVGGLTSYTLHQYYSVSPLAYIYDIAVKRELQRKGIGKLLISNLITYCKNNGFEEVFVQADKVDNHAIEFYCSTGAVEKQVAYFNYLLKNK